jgi:hypothetical protein
VSAFLQFHDESVADHPKTYISEHPPVKPA